MTDRTTSASLTAADGTRSLDRHVRRAGRKDEKREKGKDTEREGNRKVWYKQIERNEIHSPEITSYQRTVGTDPGPCNKGSKIC